jgi:hypothetical protein
MHIIVNYITKAYKFIEKMSLYEKLILNFSTIAGPIHSCANLKHVYVCSVS